MNTAAGSKNGSELKSFPVFFYLTAKRQWKRPAFFLLPGAVLLFCLLFSRLSLSEPSQAAVALYASPSDTVSLSVCESLCKDTDSPYTFYLAASEDALYEDVAAKRAECGFLLPEGLLDAVDAGTLRRQIVIVTAPDSLLQDVAAETVFAAWFQEYALHALQTTLQETLPGQHGLEAEAETLYRSYIDSGSVFSFTYQNAAEGAIMTDELTAVDPAADSGLFSLVTLRRLLYLFLFLSCYVGGLCVYRDTACGFYRVISRQRAFAAKCAALLTPLLLCAFVLWLGGSLFLPELSGSAFLSGILSISADSFVFCLLALYLLPTQKSYTALLPPLLLLGSILLLV